MQKIKISPSLLACDFLHLEDEVRRAEEAGADMLHCDVMDGVYVPNISFGFDIISKIGRITRLPLDVHMMTVCPEKYLEVLKEAGAYYVTVHSDYSDGETVRNTVRRIKELGMKAGISLKPARPAADIFDMAEMADMILVMTVEPGFGGQKFMADMMPKVREIREFISSRGLRCDIQVDGGIGTSTISEAAEAGANVFVVGTGAFRADDMKEAVKTLRNTAKKASGSMMGGKNKIK
ncbi:MAG: ribulose-phosphate 3-epimerase [Clostridia bacterium]|nr:ribulose-phosphate 3-epimerase [Clostridia bacterium]